MTKQEKITYIENKIRKDIPRLSLLGEGCYIKFTDKNGTKEIGKVCKLIYKPSENIPDTEELYAVLVTIEEKLNYNTYFLGINSIEIIGHKITIIDILEWLNDYEYYIDTGGDMYEHDMTYVYDSSGFMYLCSFNLDKPLLEDQPEETINFLYNLEKQ